MYTMKCVKPFLHYYLIVSVVLEVGSIKNYPTDKNLITEEERRGAEKLDNSTTQVPASVSSETKKRGLFLTTKHRSPALIHPGLAIGYDAKEPVEEDYDGHRPSHSFGSDRTFYSSSGPREGYIGHYPAGPYPGEYGGGYGQSGGGIYGHSGGGFGYPVEGFGHGTGIGHHGGGGGGYKNPLALKGLLLPLAGIALLGAAAALTANPVLLQLGVINGRRRRRGLIQVSNDVYPANHVIKPRKN